MRRLHYFWAVLPLWLQIVKCLVMRYILAETKQMWHEKQLKMFPSKISTRRLSAYEMTRASLNISPFD